MRNCNDGQKQADYSIILFTQLNWLCIVYLR